MNLRMLSRAGGDACKILGIGREEKAKNSVHPAEARANSTFMQVVVY